MENIDRRRGIVHLHEDDIHNLLNLPEDYSIRGVEGNFRRGSIDVMICGPGLPEVPLGCEAPTLFSTREFIHDGVDEVIGVKIGVTHVRSS